MRRAAGYVIWVGAAAALAAQQPAGPFRVERPIITAGPGPQRLAPDVPLLARSQRFANVRRLGRSESRAEGGLSDLRLFDSQGREVPYLLVHPSREPQWILGAIAPVAATKKTSGFEADFGEVRTVDMIVVEGLPAPFLKRLVLEGSGDRERWTLLAGEGTLFDLPQERLRQSSVPFARGAYRYLRITWDDTNSGRMPPPRSVGARIVPDDTAPHAPLTAAVGVQRRPSEPGRSRYRVALPAAGLPVVAVALDVGPGHVFRTASISEARLESTEASPVVLGQDTLARIERDGVVAAALRIQIAPPREAELELVVEDGSNPPLDLKGVSIELAEMPWIYFEAPGREDGPLTARYGQPSAVAPVYDLEAVRGALKLAAVPQARWGEPLEAPTAPAAPAPQLADTGAAIEVSAFRHRRSIPAGPGGLTVLPLDVAALAHSRGPHGGFADVRIADESGRQVPYLLERRDEPVTVPLTLSSAASNVAGLRPEPGQQRSVYRVALPYPNLPSPRLVLETSDRVFRRHVQVAVERRPDRDHRAEWADVLAAAFWQHAAPDVAAPALLLSLPVQEASELFVIVDEGDNRPLAISRAQLLLPSWRLRFYSPARPLWLLYGHDHLPSPRYDLALLAPRVMGAEARDAAAASETSAAAETPALVTPRMFWIGLAAAVAVLLALIIRLVAGSSAASSPPLPPAP